MASAVASIASILSVPFTFTYGLISTGSLQGGIETATKAAQSIYASVDPADAARYQAIADIGNTSQGASTPTPVTTPTTPTSAGVSTNAQTWADIARERNYAAQTQIGSMQEQLGQEVGGLETQETTAEGQVRASAAGRGLKLEGSPLMQLIAQKGAGAQAIGYAQRQGAAAIEGAGTQAQASYDSAILAANENKMYQEAGLQSQWLQSFSDVMTAAEWTMGLPGANWTPQNNQPSTDTSPQSSNYWDY